jgi:hypothetical protein
LTVAAIPLLTYLCGAVLFIPADVLIAVRAYTANGVLYAVALAAAGLMFLMHRGRVRTEADPLLMLFPLIWVLGQLFIYVATWHVWRTALVGGADAVGRPLGNLFAVAAGMTLSLAITVAAHRPESPAP